MTSYLCVIVVLLAVGSLMADELHKYERAIQECRINHDITEQDMKDAREGKIDFDDYKTKCGSTCVMKYLDMINKDGVIEEQTMLRKMEELMKEVPRDDLPCKDKCAHMINVAKQCAQEIKQKNLQGCDMGGHFAKCTNKHMGFLPM